MRQAQTKGGQQFTLAAMNTSGEGGIRTRGTCDSTRHFQCRTFGLSVTSPLLANRMLLLALRQGILLKFPADKGLATTFANQRGGCLGV